MHYANIANSKSIWLPAFLLSLLIIQKVSGETWEGYNKLEFTVQGRKAFLIEPAEAASGNPWIWRTEFFGHEPQADLALLKKGFHVAYVDVQNLTHTGFDDQVTESQTPFGYEYFLLRNGLQRCRTKFEQDKRGRVAFLGGSITASKGWRDLVCEDLKRRFPETQFDFVSSGIPSLGSTPGAFRFQRDVLAGGPVDLLFEEAAVNDDTNGFSDVEQVRGMEGIVRQALLSNPQMDIVLLHFVDPGKITEIRSGKTPSVIVNHERVAEHYRIPSINLAREVTERIDAGEFTWEKDFRDLHPAPFGHALYASSIGRMLSAAWSESSPTRTVAVVTLPAPLDSASYFYGRLVSPKELVVNKKISMVNGWRLDEQWKPTGKAGTRPGFVNVPALIGEGAGATLKLTFKGIGIGIFIASGPDTGNIDYRIDQGEWHKQELFTQWSPGLHLPWAKMLASELADGTHELEMRVSEKSDERSQGQAIRIIHFLLNDPT